MRPKLNQGVDWLGFSCLPTMCLLLGFVLSVSAQAGGSEDTLDGLFQIGEVKGHVGENETTEGRGWNPKFQGYFGFFQNKTAYTYPAVGHWSLSRNLLEVGGKGTLAPGIKWLVSGRIGYDPVYATTNYYPADVRHDQTLELMFRETYLDASLGDFDFRIGRQNIIWGEMVGLFFADVLTAKDLRQFIVQDLDTLRIPQWAIRGEYFKGNFHAEAVWLPVVTFDNIGKVGSEFYPFHPLPIPGFSTIVKNDHFPSHSIDNSAYGLRLSYLWSGYDTSVFYYSTPDNFPAFEQTVSLGMSRSISYNPVHERVQKWGVTFSKDVTDNLVLRGEAVYTQDRLIAVPASAIFSRLEKQDIVDYVLGLNFTLPEETRVNAQFFQSIFTKYNSSNFLPEVSAGYSVLLSTRVFHPKVEPQVTFLQFVDRSNWLMQAKTTWEFATNWRASAGVDIFGGPSDTLFGQYDQKDRVYTELRYSF